LEWNAVRNGEFEESTEDKGELDASCSARLDALDGGGVVTEEFLFKAGPFG
jgi:hypothetical protein